ncbi:hypothetical protein M9435_000717 [Picochlorum sp. BPE23]|nr:hypothetical protein M9435_000717 [Picochlorum sp. BPE23]
MMLLIATVVIWAILRASDYYCDVKNEIRACVIGVSVVFMLFVIVEFMIIIVGLGGGPFHERKRRLVPVGLYVQTGLILCHLGFTVFGTYLAYNPSVAELCWRSNPCYVANGDVPSFCVPEQYNLVGSVILDADCSWITSHYNEVSRCLDNWFKLGNDWLNDAYNSSLGPPFFEKSTPSKCGLSLTLIPVYNVSYLGDAGASVGGIPEAAGYLLDNIMLESLKVIGLVSDTYPWVTSQNYDSITRPARLVPWADCSALDACEKALLSSCGEWNIIQGLPNGTDEKGLFRACVYISWASLVFTLALMILVFNANPDYSSSESWMKSLERVGKLFGFRDALVNSITEEGFSASEEFGVLLAQLFGGIDMDLTDKILGLYLAGERTFWRRLKHANSMLVMHGYSQMPCKKGFWRAVCLGVGIDGDLSPEKGPVSISDVQRSNISSMAMAEDGVYSPESSQEPMAISHSIIRLETPISLHEGGKSFDERESYTRQSITSVGNVVGDSKVVKIMVPVNINPLRLEPSIDSRSAATFYMDHCRGSVESDVLQEALYYSWFAKAAYGLQERRWKAAASGNVVVDTTDYCLSRQCCLPVSTPLQLKERFRKRNFDAIIKLTGIPPEDFLYVSYASTSFGLLPYLIMLDRKKRTVVLSVRGTVGLNDLMTDLLSQPVDINAFLPQSMLSKAPKNVDGTPIKMFGHAGILSSAKAILDSLEKHCLFFQSNKNENIEVRKLSEEITMQSKKFRENLKALSRRNEVQFPLERAQAALFEALEVLKYDIIVTGHSLGAAVASMISMCLRETYPSLHCFAFNPPGGLASPAVSQLTQDFCTSVVVGYDVISRLSIANVKSLIDDVALSLCRCNRPKLKIAMDIILGLRKNPQNAPETYCAIDEIDEEARQVLQEYLSHAKLHAKDVDARMLCPMGNIVFLRPYMMQDETTEEWDAVYADPSDIINEGIIVSKYSMEHHKISVLQHALSSA